MILPFCVRNKIILVVILVFDVIPVIHQYKDKCHTSNPFETLHTLVGNKLIINEGLNSSVISKISKNVPNYYSSTVKVQRSVDTTNEINTIKNGTKNLKGTHSINLRSKQCKAIQLSKNSSQLSIMANFGDGRLGNQMCNFASLYALHKEFGLLSYFKVQSYELLKNTFDLPKPGKKSNSSYHIWNLTCVDPRNVEWIFLSNMELMQNKKRKFIFNKFKMSHYIRLEAYVCDIKGFVPYLGELRTKMFRFKQNDMNHAKMILRKIKSMAEPQKKSVFVSIHVRLQDMGKHLTNFNVSLASSTYFRNAMKYMTNKYGSNIVFAVFSDDIPSSWILLHESNDRNQFNIIFPSFGTDSSRTSSITLAMLSLADHSILTYSTFGLWGALLRKSEGETIMPKETKTTDIGVYASNANITGLIFM